LRRFQITGGKKQSEERAMFFIDRVHLGCLKILLIFGLGSNFAH
jgi:hypothetical protein